MRWKVFEEWNEWLRESTCWQELGGHDFPGASFTFQTRAVPIPWPPTPGSSDAHSCRMAHQVARIPPNDQRPTRTTSIDAEANSEAAHPPSHAVCADQDWWAVGFAVSASSTRALDRQAHGSGKPDPLFAAGARRRVALANKLARIAWVVLARGQVYRPPVLTDWTGLQMTPV